MRDIPVVVALSAGLLSFLSPCVLSLVPVYLATIAGSEILSPDAPKARMPVFFHSLSFVFGFSAVFISLGVAAGLLGLAFSFTSVTRQISGVLLILFGSFILLSLKIPALSFEKRFNPSQSLKGGYIRSFLTGSVFSLGWSPCVGPVLGGILTLALVTETAWRGAYLLAVYSAGLGVPFLLMGVFFDTLRPVVRKIARYSRYIRLVSAILLIAIGILVITNKLALLRF